MEDKSRDESCAARRGVQEESAFTRIELLAVIVTVALLGMLIMPTLARPANDGARMVCMNNLRQLGMASQMYAADNQDYLPFPNWGGGSTVGPGWLYNSTSGAIPNPELFPWRADPPSAWESGLWYKYIRNPKSYLCPVDIRSFTYTVPSAQGGRIEKLSSYVMNGAVCGFTTSYRSCKITDVWNPRCYLLWGVNENAGGPEQPGAFAFNDGSSFPTVREGALDLMHSPNGGEVLSVDGGEHFVTLGKLDTETSAPGSGPGGKTLAWWSPFSANGN